MSKKIIKSMRGEDVDFDMLRIKAEMSAIPETADVKFRENIIQSRRRRKNSSKRKVKDMLAQQQINQKSVMQGLEKQRKQRQEEATKEQPVTIVTETVDAPIELFGVESETKAENYGRKIKKGQSNGTISD